MLYLPRGGQSSQARPSHPLSLLLHSFRLRVCVLQRSHDLIRRRRLWRRKGVLQALLPPFAVHRASSLSAHRARSVYRFAATAAAPSHTHSTPRHAGEAVQRRRRNGATQHARLAAQTWQRGGGGRAVVRTCRSAAACWRSRLDQLWCWRRRSCASRLVTRLAVASTLLVVRDGHCTCVSFVSDGRGACGLQARLGVERELVAALDERESSRRTAEAAAASGVTDLEAAAADRDRPLHHARCSPTPLF
jgi:hypothetical protein